MAFAYDPRMSLLPTRGIGHTGIAVSRLGLGGAWLGSVSDSQGEATQAVAAALDAGITCIDTDASYDDGKALPRLGHALAELDRPRASYVLSSKVGTHPDRPQDYSADATRWTIDDALQTLGTEHLDLAFIHDPQDIDAPLAPGAALDTLVQLKDEGVIRAVGLGCREHEYHQRAIATGKLDALITFKDYTLLDQSSAADLFPLAVERGVGVILGSPLDMGQFAGDPALIQDERAQAMHDWAAAHGRSIRDFALQFALAQPAVDCVLVGPATAEQVRQCVDSATTAIPDALWEAFHSRFGVRA